jgi:hypothetical protein
VVRGSAAPEPASWSVVDVEITERIKRRIRAEKQLLAANEREFCMGGLWLSRREHWSDPKAPVPPAPTVEQLRKHIHKLGSPGVREIAAAYGLDLKRDLDQA